MNALAPRAKPGDKPLSSEGGGRGKDGVKALEPRAKPCVKGQSSQSLGKNLEPPHGAQ